ncbi:DUF2945 domain-containing protein [Streptomyces sp. NBC_00481]|uniref:DUF2945 domain-containing protein n=1 Tax=Streptomyces sp. NBC_00481 TaxID=2975755 RepID=UPI002DD94CED|nr:DUF2945 domain-containing protein [Streptomyces sp. NBC_00481]WRY96952.1 DUF2945 domain-containing protein [Streptomyces sp. NBC_00481]
MVRPGTREVSVSVSDGRCPVSGKQRPRRGDRVSWRSHGAEATGRVEKKITERTEAAGRTVDASAQDPQYQVRSEKSGRRAVHKPQALRVTRDVKKKG